MSAAPAPGAPAQRARQEPPPLPLQLAAAVASFALGKALSAAAVDAVRARNRARAPLQRRLSPDFSTAAGLTGKGGRWLAGKTESKVDRMEFSKHELELAPGPALRTRGGGQPLFAHPVMMVYPPQQQQVPPQLPPQLTINITRCGAAAPAEAAAPGASGGGGGGGGGRALLFRVLAVIASWELIKLHARERSRRRQRASTPPWLHNLLPRAPSLFARG